MAKREREVILVSLELRASVVSLVLEDPKELPELTVQTVLMEQTVHLVWTAVTVPTEKKALPVILAHLVFLVIRVRTANLVRLEQREKRVLQEM